MSKRYQIWDLFFPLLFPQGFRISKDFGHPTLGSGSKKTFKRYLIGEHTHTRTNRQTHGRTFRLIESIGPLGHKSRIQKTDDFFCFSKKIGFLGILGPPNCGIGATIRIGREMLCLPYAGFLVADFKYSLVSYASRVWGLTAFGITFHCPISLLCQPPLVWLLPNPQ